MQWVDTPRIGSTGFVQSRLVADKFPYLTYVEIEFHAPIYYANITRHVAGYVAQQRDGPIEFRSLKEAKAWAVVTARMNH